MSLLLNLINYSSSLQSHYNFSLENQDPKDQRSRSLYIQTQPEKNNQSRFSSKSLTKILNQKMQPVVDPKSRILHRISHLLSIKFKRHFYTLFVKLQALKKKKLYLSVDGQILPEKAPKLIDLEVQEQNKNKKQTITKLRKEKLQKFASKIEETIHHTLLKQFQIKVKSQFFQIIKANWLCKEKIFKLVEETAKCILKLNAYRFMKKIKKLNQMIFKFQILFTLVKGLNKKYSKGNLFEDLQTRSNAFQQILQFSKISKEIKLAEQRVKKRKHSPFEAQQQIKQTDLISLTPMLSISSQLALSLQSQINLIENQQTIFLNFQPSLSQPMLSLQAKISDFEKKKFNKFGPTILKSFQAKTLTGEEPMKISMQVKEDKFSYFCHKGSKDYFCENLNDKDEEANRIFLNSERRNMLSNCFKQSKVAPFIGNSLKKTKLRHEQTSSGSQDTNRTPHQTFDFSTSQISAFSLLNTDKSTNTLINNKLLNESQSFGTQCVIFKNLLVHQRQSLKQSDKNFFKKKILQKKSESQTFFYPKNFLRSTFQSKKKGKQIQELSSQRKFLSNKSLDITINANSFLKTKELIELQQLNWVKCHSSKEKLKQAEVDSRSPTIKANSNQDVYPTRDISAKKLQDLGFTFHQSTSKQPDKFDQQKNFNKIINKNDNFFSSKN